MYTLEHDLSVLQYYFTMPFLKEKKRIYYTALHKHIVNLDNNKQWIIGVALDS